MKHLAVALGIACSLAIVSWGFSQANARLNDKPDLKRVTTTMPEGGGGLRLAAESIDRDWNPPVTHLRGHVEVEIWTARKNARQITLVRADEADYYERTGEIVPRGNVRVTVEPVR